MKEFKYIPFDDVIIDATGGNDKILQSEYQKKGELPIIDQGESFIGGYTDDLSLKYSNQLPCIVFGDHTKILKFVDSDFALGADGTKILVTKKGYDPKFIFYYLHTAKFPPNVGYSRHFKFLKEISFPKFDEDYQIACRKILDKADSIRKKRKESIRLADEFLRATFLDMFGDPVANTKNWKFKILAEISLVTKLAGYEYTEHIDYKDEGEIIVIRGLNVKGGRLKLDKVKYIDKSTSEFLKRSKLNKYDVVMTYIGVNIGDVAIIPESGKYHLAPNVAKITPKDFKKLNSIFLMHCLQFNRLQFNKFTTNTAKQAFNMGNIRQVKIPVPPIELQDKFSRIVDEIELIKEKYQLSFFESEKLFNSLMQRAFRGDL